VRRFSFSAVVFAALAAALLIVSDQGFGQDRQAPANKGSMIRGRVLRMPAAGQYVIQTNEGKEVTLYAGPQTTYQLNGQAVPVSNIRVGSDLSAAYQLQDGRYMVSAFTLGAPPAVPPVPGTAPVPPAQQGTTIEGTVFRVVGTSNQFVVRTATGQEIPLVTGPQTTYRIDDRNVMFTDLREGMPVTVTYDVQNRSNMARSVIGRVLPRK